MLIEMIQTNYVLKQFLMVMNIHISEQLTVGQQKKQIINVCILNMDLIMQKLHLYQIFQILYIKEQHIFIIKKLNTIE